MSESNMFESVLKYENYIHNDLLDYCKENNIIVKSGQRCLVRNSPLQIELSVMQIKEAYKKVNSSIMNTILMHEIGHIIHINQLGLKDFRLFGEKYGKFECEVIANNHARKLANELNLHFDEAYTEFALNTYRKAVSMPLEYKYHKVA